MKNGFTIVALFIFLSAPALAATQTVTLSVPGMTCPACPFTVKAALGKVGGVTDIKMNYPKREAAVTFDDDKTSVDVLTEATANAGYPSALKCTGSLGKKANE